MKRTLLILLILLFSIFIVGCTSYKAPYIGENGNWYVNGEDTGVCATGAKGDKGETGATGAKGEKGDKGEQGVQGEQGTPGEKGETGATGEQGPKGEKGETGAQGEQGIQGEQGTPGEKGETGATGEQGPKGDQGEQGTQGEQGAPGKDGTSVHLGFDKFIYEDGVRTSIKLSNTVLADNVVEDSLDLYTYFSKYHNLSEIDLTNQVIALFGGYLPETKQTIYSSQTITSISIYAKEEGTIKIGKAYISDIYDYREDVDKFDLNISTTFDCVKGLNVIPVNIELGLHDTLFITGTITTYVMKDFDCNTTDCVYSLLNDTRHLNDILEHNSNGLYDRLVIKTVSNNNFEDIHEEKLAAYEFVKASLSNKMVSYLGDSVSSFAGYSNDSSRNTTIANNVPTYPVTILDGYKLDYVDETYWMQSLNHLNMQLCVSNTWGGTGMSTLNVNGLNVNAAGWYTRCTNLHINTGSLKGTQPDFIFVMLGVNDLFNGNPCGSYEEINFADLICYSNFYERYVYKTPKTYAEAYAVALHKMIMKYPNATIIPMGYWVNVGTMGETFTNMNGVVEKLCKHYGLNYLDLSKCDITLDNVMEMSKDGMHPNYMGMNLISHAYEDQLIQIYLDLYDKYKDGVYDYDENHNLIHTYINDKQEIVTETIKYNKPVKVFIISGQSNASGFTTMASLQSKLSEDEYNRYANGFDNVLIRYKNDNLNSSDDFVKVQLNQGVMAGFYGPEVGLAEKLTEAFPDETIYIIKFARSGSSLEKQWLDGRMDRGTYYKEMINFINESMQILTDQGIYVKIYGFCWAQGEGDASDGISNPNSYLEATTSFVSYIREDLSKYISMNGMYFVDAGISDMEVWTYQEIINQAKIDYSKTSKMNLWFSYIDNGLTSYPELEGEDSIHLNSLSQIKFGHLFAEQLINVLK